MVMGENDLYYPVVGNRVYMGLKSPEWSWAALRPLLNLLVGTVGQSLGPYLVWGNGLGVVGAGVPVGTYVGVVWGEAGRVVVTVGVGVLVDICVGVG